MLKLFNVIVNVLVTIVTVTAQPVPFCFTPENRRQNGAIAARPGRGGVPLGSRVPAGRLAHRGKPSLTTSVLGSRGIRACGFFFTPS
jgi:hypothetical protein